MLGLLWQLCRGLAETVRETLPRTTEEGGAFLSGAVYAFVLHWLLLIAVTYAHCRAGGTC